ncbi:MAG: TIGR01777 family oxidoreductase [Planctomycetota bacterium]|jgi:uncharacterized protein (TIGR01777 family)
MRVLVSGSSGLVGAALVRELQAQGHTAGRLVRRAPGSDHEVRWDPARLEIDRKGLRGWQAVVHLAGESVAKGRWSAARKKRIRESRVLGTGLLSDALAGLPDPPSTLVCASAIGFYGSRNNEVLTEESPLGKGFLASVCSAWEAAAQPALQSGIRVVQPRIGIVLSPDGGALKKMLPLFKVGLGGRLGSGEQWMSWISLPDLLGLLLRALEDESMSGAYNAVAPNPVTNAEFTETLGKVLQRPTRVSTPRFALRMMLGREMADELVLASVRVEPQRLQAHDHEFLHKDLETALRAVIQV